MKDTQNRLMKTQITFVQYEIFQKCNHKLTIFLPLEPLTQTFVMPVKKYCGCNTAGRRFLPEVVIVKCVILINVLYTCIAIAFSYILPKLTLSSGRLELLR